MAQVTISNLDTIDKLKTDPAFRKKFLENTEKFMEAEGVAIDAKTLGKVIDKQFAGIAKQPGGLAKTVAIITIF